ncbi:hypothetical protein TruAng_008388 [Truncatella angustata]|nr:hypothetical protein TruAng_008388 [Truncatella angustata]
MSHFAKPNTQAVGINQHSSVTTHDISTSVDSTGLDCDEALVNNDLDSAIVRMADPESPPVDDEIPRSWSWAFKKLTRLVTEARGEATAQIIKFVSKHLRGTKLIFVVGKAGTGKTTILSELTGLSGLVPEHSTNTGTKEYYICPAIIDDEQYLFIDTAGFGDPKCDDLDTFRNIFSCLIALGSFVQVVGVLFVLGKPGTRLDQQDVRTLRWVQCFCGPEFFRNVTFVTSFWDSYSASYFKKAYNTMQYLLEDETFCQVLHPFDPLKRYHGAYIYHHGVTGGKLTMESYPCLALEENISERRDELRGLIRRRYAELKFKPVKIQFETELEKDIPFLETEATKVLQAPAVGTTVKIIGGKCVAQVPNEGPEATVPPPKTKRDATRSTLWTSWAESIGKWFDLATTLADYFAAARQQSTPETTSRMRHTWDNIRSWWSSGSKIS